MSNCHCSESATANAYLIGGMYKFAVSMTCEGFDMATDDWTVTITRGTATGSTVTIAGATYTLWGCIYGFVARPVTLLNLA